MLAAETIFDALLERDYSARTLQEFEHRVKRSWITPELRRYRNFHAGFRHGRWLGMVNAGLQYITGGRAWGLIDRDHQEAGHEAMKKLSAFGYRDAETNLRNKALNSNEKLLLKKLRTYITQPWL